MTGLMKSDGILEETVRALLNTLRDSIYSLVWLMKGEDGGTLCTCTVQISNDIRRL